MARLTFKCAKGEACPNNPADHFGTGNKAGEFCLFLQHWMDAAENQLVKWNARGIRCGCGAPFRAIVVTEPDRPADDLPPMAPDPAAEAAELARAREAFEGETPESQTVIRRWYGGALPWETSPTAASDTVIPPPSETEIGGAPGSMDAVG